MHTHTQAHLDLANGIQLGYSGSRRREPSCPRIHRAPIGHQEDFVRLLPNSSEYMLMGWRLPLMPGRDPRHLNTSGKRWLVMLPLLQPDET